MSSTLRRLETAASLAGQAFGAIREGILKMELLPGEPLVEAKLASALGISKTPIRQALQRLEQTRLVVAIPYKGYFVSELTLRDAREVLEIRAVLEGLAVSEACLRLSEAELQELALLLDQMRNTLQSGQIDLCAQLGHQFHRLLIDKADNGRLASMIDILNDQFHRVRLLSSHIPGRLPRSVEEHARVLDALRSSDAARAERLMREHLLAVYEDLAQDDTLPRSSDGRRGHSALLPHDGDLQRGYPRGVHKMATR